MKKNPFIKMLVIGCIIILLGSSTISIAKSNTQKQDMIYRNNLGENEKAVKMNIYDSTNGRIVKTDHILSADQAQQIIKTFMETEMTQDLFYSQVREKLQILQDNDLVSEKTANTLTKSFNKHQLIFQKRNIPSRPTAVSDVANLINVVVFGLKGEKVKTIFELNTVQLPFFNGTISGQFSLASKFAGNGTVFSLGLLGWKYSYGQNQTQYPDFPYFPSIAGGVIAFTGILIEVESNQPGYPGHYIIGMGMSLLTVWNQV